jgi:hypothetical protein
MKKKTKKEKILDIVEQLSEIYPHLDRVLITDMENPKSIIITSSEVVDEVAEEVGIDPEDLEEYMDRDDEDDDGEGHLH